MYSTCLLLSLPAAPLTFPPHNKRAPLNALYGVVVGVLESCHLIRSEDFAIPQSLTRPRAKNTLETLKSTRQYGVCTKTQSQSHGRIFGKTRAAFRNAPEVYPKFGTNIIEIFIFFNNNDILSDF